MQAPFPHKSAQLLSPCLSRLIPLPVLHFCHLRGSCGVPMESAALLDIDDCPPFVPSDWIGVGRTYSGELPFEVISAKNAVLRIPTDATAHLIPPSTLSVAKFAKLDLPRHSSELAFGQSQTWFSKDAPTTDTLLLKNRHIPPRAVLDLLTRKFPHAWLDGVQSISDPRLNDGADRFPLWSLTFWKDMSEIIGQQVTWRRSIRWLENEGYRLAENGSCRPHDGGFSYASGIRSRVSGQGHGGPPRLFGGSDRVTGSKVRSNTKKNSPLLHLYKAEVKEKKKERLYFPANVGDSHWVAGNIDFKKKNYRFWRFTSGILRAANFDCQYDSMEHGIQKDGYSCGIVMDNTIENGIFCTGVWIPRRAVLERITRFLKYVSHQQTAPGKSEVLSKLYQAVRDDGEDKRLESYPELSISVALGDHNFENLREFALTTIAEDNDNQLAADITMHLHASRSLADPLNPQEDRSARSISSDGTSESRDFSDSDVVLGRVDWDSDLQGTEDNGASDHQTVVSFATSSGMDGGGDIPRPGVRLRIGLGRRDARSCSYKEDLRGEAGKAKKQSTLFGFLKPIGSGRSTADAMKTGAANSLKWPPSRGNSDTASSVKQKIPATKKQKVDPAGVYGVLIHHHL
ncbi:hypothetical protein B0H10DRAFT_2275035 [Mycena sp. CBHHK59/15]|nr:hypothetical protein B0H10DRAFT_2275035 [Mycena sp. CBHHK59/15]